MCSIQAASSFFLVDMIQSLQKERMTTKNETPLSPEAQYHRQITDLVKRYIRQHPGERERLSGLKGLLRKHQILTNRKNYDGHLTASAVVVDTSHRILLIYHKALHKWLQPGGHVDGLETPLAAARREIEEETKLTHVQLHPALLTQNLPFDIDTHLIPANEAKQEAAHPHHDFRYMFLAAQGNVELDVTEVTQYDWATLDEARQRLSGFPWDKVEALIQPIT